MPNDETKQRSITSLVEEANGIIAAGYTHAKPIAHFASGCQYLAAEADRRIAALEREKAELVDWIMARIEEDLVPQLGAEHLKHVPSRHRDHADTLVKIGVWILEDDGPGLYRPVEGE